jgi:ligand-binding sensor domain-containing protein
MRYKRYLVLYLYFCLLLPVCCIAEPGSVPVKSLAAQANARRMIVHNDYLWIAGGGLTRYHFAGGEVNQYLTEHGLVANALFDAAIDVKNRVLWAATSSGLGRLDLETHQWKSFGRKQGLPDPFVLSLDIYEKQGKTLLFIGTREDGLYFLSGGSDKITRAVDKKMLPDLWVSCMAADPCHNYLWLGTAAGVVRCQLKNNKWPLKIDPLLAHNRIAAKRLVLDEPTGDVFCLNYYNEIFLYRLSAKKWEIIPSPPGKSIKISDLALDSAANILWTTTDRGIYGFRVKQKQWTRLPGFQEEGFCIALDPQSSTLYYTSRHGINFLSLKSTMATIKSFCGGGLKNEGGKGRRVSVQLKKPSGGPKGLIGPPCHGALVAEGKGSRFLLPNSPPFNNTVTAIYIDKKTSTTWVGTDWGIAKLENKTSQWKFFPLSSYPGERVMAVSVDDKHVWFGTVHHGLCKMHRKTGVINEIKGTPEDAMVTSIIKDEKAKKIWFGLLGTLGGVYEYDMEKGTMRVLPFLDYQSVTYLLEEGDWIWVGTGRGVARFHKLKGPRADLFDPGLAFGQVLTMALDNKRNHLWITTEFEVIVYNRVKKQHKIFKSPEGFPWSPITSILFDGERIWLGSEGYGLYVYDPREEVKNPLTRVEGTADSFIITLTHDKRKGVVWVGTVYGGISIVNSEPGKSYDFHSN